MSSTILVNRQSLEDILDENRKLQERVLSLEAELKTLKRKLYGKKSERLPKLTQKNTKQSITSDLSLSVEDKLILKKLLEDEPFLGVTEPKSKPNDGDLAYERIDVDLSDKEKFCQHCSHALHRIGEETSKQLDYIEPKFKLKEIVRYKYGCRHCEISVTIPAKPGRKGKQLKASPGLLTYLMVAKYCDHLPLYRLEQIFKRQGYRIARSTLCDWMRQAKERLVHYVSNVKNNVLSELKINTDDTVLPVQDRTLKGRTRTGRMWVYTNKKGCVYEYTAGRGREGPNTFLKGYQGIIQADGYSGYNESCRQNGIQRSACWAHVRRKFYDVAQLSNEAGKPHIALGYIQKLYAIENQVKELSDEQKLQFRQRLAKPILNEFNSWLKQQIKIMMPKCHFARAIKYALKFWNELILYCDYACLDIDNNAAERAMRPIALGRKNWLFAGSNEGAKTAATIMSVIETAKQQQENVTLFIRNLLEAANCGEIVGCV